MRSTLDIDPPFIARIGLLGVTAPSGVEGSLKRFRAGLRDSRVRRYLSDFRWAERNYARLAKFAAELIRLRIDVLVTYGTPGTLAAKQATAILPIIMLVGGDAVATGIVASLARPGGNVTGSTFFDPELHAKRLELVKEAWLSAVRIGVLLNPDNPVNTPLMQAMKLTAKSLKLELQPCEARGPDEFQGVFRG